MAHDLLDFLQKRFSIGSAASAQHVKDSILKLSCALNAIPNYVQSWHTAVNQMAKTPWDFTPYEKIQGFMDGVPDHKAFDYVCEEVCYSWDCKGDL